MVTRLGGSALPMQVYGSFAGRTAEAVAAVPDLVLFTTETFSTPTFTGATFTVPEFGTETFTVPAFDTETWNN